MTKPTTGALSRFFALLWVTLLLFYGAPRVAYGQDGGWSTPVDMGPYWFPAILADASGQVHMAWTSGGDGYDTVMYASRQEDAEWNVPNDIMASPRVAGAEATRPSLAADERGILHMTYRRQQVLYAQAPISRAGAASAWRTPMPLSSTQGAYFSQVVVGPGNVLHVVYTENLPDANCTICYHLFYRQSSDDGRSWSEPLDISSLPTGSAKPQLILEGTDLYVVWEAGPGGSQGQLGEPTAVRFAASHDGGTTWTQPRESLSLPAGEQAKNITLGRDGQGRLLIVWLRLPEDRVYFQISADHGLTWSQPLPILQIWGGWSRYANRLDSYSLAADSAGNLHLLLVGRTAYEERELRVLHLTWDGSGWSYPQTVASLGGDVAEWTRLAIGRGFQLHATWFTRDAANIWQSDSDTAQYRVWYAQTSVPAPATAPIQWSGVPAVPSPEPTVAPTPTLGRPSAAGSLPPAPVVPEAAEWLRTEVDELVSVAQGVAPLALGILILVIGRLARRHRSR